MGPLLPDSLSVCPLPVGPLLEMEVVLALQSHAPLSSWISPWYPALLALFGHAHPLCWLCLLSPCKFLGRQRWGSLSTSAIVAGWLGSSGHPPLPFRHHLSSFRLSPLSWPLLPSCFPLSPFFFTGVGGQVCLESLLLLSGFPAAEITPPPNPSPCCCPGPVQTLQAAGAHLCPFAV